MALAKSSPTGKQSPRRVACGRKYRYCWLAITEQSSGLPMAEITGPFSLAARRETLWAVSFTDSSNGTAVGEVGTIVRTTDGGAHWSPQTSGTVLNLRAVSFTDWNSACGCRRRRRHSSRTTDGGSTWGPSSQAARRRLCLGDCSSFSDSNTGTAVGGDVWSERNLQDDGWRRRLDSAGKPRGGVPF